MILEKVFNLIFKIYHAVYVSVYLPLEIYRVKPNPVILWLVMKERKRSAYQENAVLSVKVSTK
jgi:hypothetical protein